MSDEAPKQSASPSPSRADTVEEIQQAQRKDLQRESERTRFGLWLGLLIIVVGGAYLILANPTEERNELRVAMPRDPQTLDPHAATDIDSGRINQLIYEGLVDYVRSEDALAEDPIPALARDWEVSPDQLTYTFHLREGVRFHDGAELDARAVKMSLDRARGVDETYFGEALAEPPYQNFYRDIEEVEVVDDMTVKLHVSEPNVALLRNLAMTTASIISPDNLRALAEGTDTKVHAGTGPLRFHSQQRGQVTTLARFEDYWGTEEHGAVAFDRVLFRVVEHPEQRYNELLTGRVDVAVDIRPEHEHRLEDHPQLVKSAVEVPNVCYLVLNPNPEIPRLRGEEPRENPMAPQWVREAITLAIDKDRVVERVYRDQAVPAHSMLPPTILGHPHHWEREPLEARRERVRELLAEHGYDTDNPFEVTLNHFTGPRAYIPDATRLAREIQSQLEEVGIDVTLSPEPWDQYSDRSQQGVYPFLIIGWQTVSGDPDYTFSPLFGVDEQGNPVGLNMPKWVDEEFLELVGRARAEFDRDERERLYHELEARLRDAWVTVPLAHYTPIWGLRNHVENFGVSPVGRLLIERIRVRR